MTIPAPLDLPPGCLAARREHLVSEVSRRRRGTRPARLLAIAAVALGLTAGSALALSGRARELVGLSSGPHPVLASARLEVSAPAPHDQRLGLYTARSTDGGDCVLVAVAPPGRRPKPSGRGGYACGSRQPRAGDGLTWGFTQVRRPTGPGIRTWIPAAVDGWIGPKRHAARVELEWRRGHQRLAFRNGYFIGATPILYSPPFADLPFYLVAYDAQGHQVAIAKLNNASLYLDWKRNHVEDRLRAYWREHGRPPPR